MQKKAGQILIGIPTIVGLILTATGTVGAFYVGQGNQDQHIAVLEAEVDNTKEDVVEIKSDLKEILKLLRNEQD